MSTGEKIEQDNSAINIIMALNNNYAPHSAGVIASIVLNKKESNKNVIIYILHKDLIQENIDKIKAIEQLDVSQKTKVIFVKIQDNFEAVNFSGSWPVETLYRLYIPKLFPELDKIIYLDPDIVVIEDVTKLDEINIDSFCIAGIKDLICLNLIKSKKIVTYKGKKSSWVEYYKYIGLDENQLYNYVQAGVLIFNIKKIKAEGKENIMLETMKQNEHFIFSDQDAINVAFKGDIHYLDTRWNFIDPRLELLENNLNYDENKEVELARENPYKIII